MKIDMMAASACSIKKHTYIQTDHIESRCQSVIPINLSPSLSIHSLHSLTHTHIDLFDPFHLFLLLSLLMEGLGYISNFISYYELKFFPILFFSFPSLHISSLFFFDVQHTRKKNKTKYMNWMNCILLLLLYLPGGLSMLLFCDYRVETILVNRIYMVEWSKKKK